MIKLRKSGDPWQGCDVSARTARAMIPEGAHA